MKDKKTFTDTQKRVIQEHNGNMLVSASAGTGKTTVMIERIVQMIANGANVDDFVVVTFTNLAAAEMKTRLADKLSQMPNSPHIARQTERLDTANISTLHSFCSELLRNYFYIVDVDPSYTILDDMITATLRKNALTDVIKQYFDENDQDFADIYKIYATHRTEETFAQVIYKIHNFSRCINNFDEWYSNTRNNFVTYSPSNPIVQTLLEDISARVNHTEKSLRNLASRATDEGLGFADIITANADIIAKIDKNDLDKAFNGVSLAKSAFNRLPNKDRSAGQIECKIRDDYTAVTKSWDSIVKKYIANLQRGESLDKLWDEMVCSVKHVDKLVEVVNRFDKTFYEAKKQRGGIDFNDLEHLTLQLLQDEETLQMIRQRYKYVFVDEYQDTNPVQEAIISKLANGNNLFMVGDVKQSIYGFRGCEPDIFVRKKQLYQQDTTQGTVYELNDNFRSNNKILQFVNGLFNTLMTNEFGKVDYKNTAQLHSDCEPKFNLPSVQIDFVQATSHERTKAQGIYDITADTDCEQGLQQSRQVVARIKQYVGKHYTDGDKKRTIGYGDIVILMRSLKDRAVDIYNALLQNNIPVVANFKVEGYTNKEVRELITLLRVLDNPYNDVYLVGTCLSCFGKFTENELGTIRLATPDWTAFCDRLKQYRQNNNDQICAKIDNISEFLRKMRFFSRSATVSEVCIKVLQETEYELYVKGLPNGEMRLNKLYDFINSVKQASYGQSIDKFLSYLDETEDTRMEDSLGQANAVRIMTMHASKGLEFPIVIIAGVENKFMFDNDSVERNFDLGIATKYYNLANMRSAHTLGEVACNLCSRNKVLEEQMRLLYVATTRAKYLLNIIGTVSKNQLEDMPTLPQSAVNHLDWILSAVKTTTSEQFAHTEHLDVSVITEQPLQQNTSNSADIVTISDTQRNLVLGQLDIPYTFANQADMPGKVVSSQLDREYLQLDETRAETVIQDNANRNYIGTAYHKVYQYVDYNADLQQIQQTIDGLVGDGKIDTQFASQLDVNLIYNTLHNDKLQTLLQQGQVYHEQPFMLYAPYNQLCKDTNYTDKVMLQGVIDLLVIGRDKAIVVDFKYTQKSAERVEQSYQMQLASYRYAVQQICGITNVECYVLSIADNNLIPMP